MLAAAPETAAGVLPTQELHTWWDTPHRASKQSMSEYSLIAIPILTARQQDTKQQHVLDMEIM